MEFTKQDIDSAAKKAFSKIDDILEQLRKTPPTSIVGYAISIYSQILAQREGGWCAKIDDEKSWVTQRVERRLKRLKNVIEHASAFEDAEFGTLDIIVMGDAIKGPHLKGAAWYGLEGFVMTLFDLWDKDDEERLQPIAPVSKEHLFKTLAMDDISRNYKQSFFRNMMKMIDEKLLRQLTIELGLQDEYRAYFLQHQEWLINETRAKLAERGAKN